MKQITNIITFYNFNSLSLFVTKWRSKILYTNICRLTFSADTKYFSNGQILLQSINISWIDKPTDCVFHVLIKK